MDAIDSLPILFLYCFICFILGSKRICTPNFSLRKMETLYEAFEAIVIYIKYLFIPSPVELYWFLYLK